MVDTERSDTQWDLWEVFVQETAGEAHVHAGSVRAADPEMALQNARDVYARRGRASSLWVVRSSEIVATSPEDAGAFFERSDKVYRHPQFYKIPRGVRFS